jgi:PilZ domain
MEMEDSVLCSITGHEHVRSDAARGEKRKALRIPMSQRVSLTIIRPQPRGGMAIVREISSHGIGLLGELVMEAGSEFVVEFPRPGFAPLWVLYRTVRCTRAGGQHRLNFIGALFWGMESTAPKIVAAKPIESLASADEANELDRIRQAVLGS